MIELVVITSLIVGCAIYMQKKSHEHFERCKYKENEVKVNEELTAMVKDFADYKKRVDTLTLKAGFKL